ncbi:MAG TPA: HAMP domain-containing sensor histidine kinase [Micromonosporaceae bacterium]|nr:HAMP domain-containing sensor histidine kinase [Micromonosporaceae bacterium]
MPLRTKLILVVLALVAVALLAVGVLSSWALRSYMIGRIDKQLADTKTTFDLGAFPDTDVVGFVPPTAWLVAEKDDHGVGPVIPETLSKGVQPIWPRDIGQFMAVPTDPYTVRSVDGTTSWRLLATPIFGGDRLLFLGQRLTDVDGAVDRLIAIELVVGAVTLVVLSAVGVGLIRRSMRPLIDMERTAVAIADGDLTRRVPEFEPDRVVPRTEVGALGRSLNTMLAQIEAALLARARSEAAARAAASSARDAADLARRSEVRARRSEERMRQFAADASHELRTPLTTIRGFAELYRQGAAREPAETARLMRRIEDEASRMGMLVDDLLLLARLDQERPLEQVPVDLRVVASDAVVNASATAPDRRIGVDIAPGTGSLVVIGDDLRLRQVLTNLMSNALSYTPAGTPITVRLATEPAARTGTAATGTAVVSVVDEGPGLSPDSAGRVFERFYRGDTARSRVAGDGTTPSGTGLGLAIVAALVKAHGGTVEAAETPGHGATFHVRLPLAVPDPDPDSDPPGGETDDQA